MKVGMKTNFGRLAKIFQIYSMDANLILDFNYKLQMTSIMMKT